VLQEVYITAMQKPPAVTSECELVRWLFQVTVNRCRLEHRRHSRRRRLWYFTDLNSREIGQITNLPEATVRGRLRAARRKLAEVLSDWNDTV
jgi:DNA-directed RNA polymerase specialized sigma24 family protein